MLFRSIGILPDAQNGSRGLRLTMRLLPDRFDADDLCELHRLIKSHGQKVCHHQGQTCSSCALADLCAQRPTQASQAPMPQNAVRDNTLSNEDVARDVVPEEVRSEPEGIVTPDSVPEASVPKGELGEAPQAFEPLREPDPSPDQVPSPIMPKTGVAARPSLAGQAPRRRLAPRPLYRRLAV